MPIPVVNSASESFWRKTRGLSFLMAGIVFFAIIGVSLTVAGVAAAKRHLAQKQEQAQYVDSVVAEASAVLTNLVLQVSPDCSPATLSLLRQKVFNSNVVSDIAVLDDSRQAICSTTFGHLNTPIKAFKPDFYLQSQVGLIDVTEDPNAYPVSEGRLITLGRLGHFQITLSPHVIATMRKAKFDVVGYIKADGTVQYIRGNMTQQEAKDSGIVDNPALSRIDAGNLVFNWAQLEYEYHHRVAAMSLFYFSRASIYAPGLTTPVFKFVTLLVAFIAGVIVQVFTASQISQRASIRYQIGKLLNARNIRIAYQPIFSLKTNEIVGCEVLVRLQDGERLHMPDAFLPAVVERGLTWKLDQLVCETSIRALQNTIPDNMTFRVALNLFPENIKAQRLHTLFHDTLGVHRGSNLVLDLEVIEHEYQSQMLNEVGELKQLGYKVCVDDFGTGYSNLGSVRMMRPDYLKIDRSFVRDMETATVRSTLIPEIIAIARATDAEIVAEGIENAAQRDALKALGVEYGQGYFLGKPMPLELLIRLINEQRNNVLGPGQAWPGRVTVAYSNGSYATLSE